MRAAATIRAWMRASCVSDFRFSGDVAHPRSELGRKGRFNRDGLARRGLRETDPVRVQKIAGERRTARDLRRSTIEPVADNRVSNAREVHADLVGAAGTDADFEQRESGE